MIRIRYGTKILSNNYLQKLSVINYERKRLSLDNPQNRQFSNAYSFGTIWNTISNSTPVEYLQNGLVLFHDTTGLPWWSTIIISTIMLRTVITFPIAVYQVKFIKF